VVSVIKKYTNRESAAAHSYRIKAGGDKYIAIKLLFIEQAGFFHACCLLIAEPGCWLNFPDKKRHENP
jgi:hypothetical protein